MASKCVSSGTFVCQGAPVYDLMATLQHRAQCDHHLHSADSYILTHGSAEQVQVIWLLYLLTLTSRGFVLSHTNLSHPGLTV